MDSKKTGLRATKLDLIRAINDETDEARLEQLAGDLIKKGTPNGCALDELCADLQTELVELHGRRRVRVRPGHRTATRPLAVDVA